MHTPVEKNILFIFISSLRAQTGGAQGSLFDLCSGMIRAQVSEIGPVLAAGKVETIPTALLLCP